MCAKKLPPPRGVIRGGADGAVQHFEGERGAERVVRIAGWLGGTVGQGRIFGRAREGSEGPSGRGRKKIKNANKSRLK